MATKGETTSSSRASASAFGAQSVSYIERGWPQEALLPGMPGTKRPGRWTGRRWVGMKGHGLLKQGLAAADEPTSWEDVQQWPTDTVCVRGTHVVGLDIDSESDRVVDLARNIVSSQYERGRVGSNRTLIPFMAIGEVKAWRPIRFTLAGYDGQHTIELNGHGKQWVACGTHPKGGAYTWRDTVGDMGGPPARYELQEIDQGKADEIRSALVFTLRKAGAVFIDGSDEPLLRAHAQLDSVETDDLEPTIPVELFEEVLLAIPDNRETVGGWDEAIPLLASMRYVLGREGAALPECVEAWASAFDGNTEWIEARWTSFDMGVQVREGTFLQWVERWAPPELAGRVQAYVDRARVVEGFAGIEEEPEEDDGAGPIGDAPSGMKGTPNLAETVAFLLQSPAIRGAMGYCLFRHQAVLRKPIPRPDGAMPRKFTERAWSDQDELDVLMWAQANGLPKLQKGTAIDACIALASMHEFHPVRDYLKGLAWDGKGRLDSWLADLASAEGDPAYLRAVGRATLISAVARVMRPGCKVDTVLVMEAAQGAGKSTLFKSMMPVPDWFSDSMPHDLASKDARAHLKGKWIIEIPELAQLKRTEVAALKGFITTATDTYRGSYQRNEATYPRQSIFFGSTNEDQYLVDDTGNRRYWPVKLTAKVDLAQVEAERDQLWAEAHAAWKAGETWWLKDDVLAIAEKEQAERKQIDPWTDKVQAFVDGAMIDQVSATAMLKDAIGMEVAHMGKSHVMRMSAVLKGMGWERVKSRQGTGDGRPAWLYRRVGTFQPNSDDVMERQRKGRANLTVVSQPTVP